ncbi:MAG: lipoate--protein ligase family protein, partial [Candidatus Hodarchaeales archaeon]
LIPFGRYSGSLNMAIDEILLLQKIKKKKSMPNILRFYGWSPGCCSIGIHQDLLAEVDVDATHAAGIDYVRRISGGGAVYHDSEGELTYSIVVDSQEYDLDSVDESFIKLSNWIIDGLNSIGMDLQHDRIHCPSLYTRNKKKISGNTQCRKGRFILQHGTILLKYNPSTMYTYLRVREGVPKEKVVRSVFANVTTIEEELGISMKPETIIPVLIKAFEKEFNLSLFVKDLTQDELTSARELESKKYATREWNYNKRESR